MAEVKARTTGRKVTLRDGREFRAALSEDGDAVCYELPATDGVTITRIALSHEALDAMNVLSHDLRTDGVALPANTFRQGNWSHPDGDGSRIIGWRIPKADVERMGADAYVLPQEVSDALARLSAAHGVAIPLNGQEKNDA